MNETHGISATDLSPQKRIDCTSEFNRTHERTNPSLEQSEGTKQFLAQAPESNGTATSDSETMVQRLQQRLSSAETKHDHMQRQLEHLKKWRLILSKQLKQAKSKEECPELVTKEKAPMLHDRSDDAIHETAAISEDEHNNSALADSETMINDESHASTDHYSIPIDVTRSARKLEPSSLNNPKQLTRQNALDLDHDSPRNRITMGKFSFSSIDEKDLQGISHLTENEGVSASDCIKSVEKYITPQRRSNSDAFVVADRSFSPFVTFTKKCEGKNNISQENCWQALSNTTTAKNRNANLDHENYKEQVSMVKEFLRFAPYTNKQTFKMDSSNFIRPINGKMQNTAISVPTGHKKTYSTVVRNAHVQINGTQVPRASSGIGTNRITPSNKSTKSVEQDDSAVKCRKSSENKRNTVPSVGQSDCQHLSSESCCRSTSSFPYELDTSAEPSAIGNVDEAVNPNNSAYLSFYAPSNKELTNAFLANLRGCSAKSPMFGSI